MDGAMNDYSKAIDLDERSADAHWGLALTLVAQGHPGGAIAHLKRVIEVAPDATLADIAQAKLDDLAADSNP